jgi:ubiquinone/menaquinone biosynthesis C-methylase UbiE
VKKLIYGRLLNEILFDLTHLDYTIVTTYLQFVNGTIKSKITLNQDLSSEIFHWTREFHAYKHRGKPLFGQIKHKKCKESIRYALDCLQKDVTEELRVIEVGCGPTSQFYAEDLARKPLSIITVDPLAKVYRRLHDQYKTGYNIMCIEGYGENLNKLFPEQAFHLVYSQNAIDHSMNPQLFVKNMSRILKVGCFLVLSGFIKEGTKANWLGLHQWDIEVKNGKLLISNRSKSICEKNLTQHLCLQLISGKVESKSETYTFIYKKNK